MLHDGLFWALALSWIGNGLGALVPGPNMIAVASAGMGSGRKPAIMLAAGIASGAVVWCLGLNIGLGRIFELYPQSQSAVSLLGGGYLVFLGQNSLRNAHRAKIGKTGAIEALSPYRAWQRGLAINLSNPKSALFWVSIAAYIQSYDIGIWVLLAFVAAVSAESFLIYGTYGFVFSADWFRKLFNRHARYFEFAFGAVFIAIGVILIVDAVV